MCKQQGSAVLHRSVKHLTFDRLLVYIDLVRSVFPEHSNPCSWFPVISSRIKLLHMAGIPLNVNFGDGNSGAQFFGPVSHSQINFQGGSVSAEHGSFQENLCVP